MKCTHENQHPIGRRLIGGVERVVFQCQDWLGAAVLVCNDLDVFMPWYTQRYGVMGQMRLEAPNA